MKYEDDFNSESAWQERMVIQYCVFMRFCPTVLLFPVMNMSWLLPPTRDQRVVKFPAGTMPLGNRNNKRGCPKFRLLPQIMVNINTDFKQISSEGADYIHLAHRKVKWLAVVSLVMNTMFIYETGTLLASWEYISCSRMTIPEATVLVSCLVGWIVI
jgi:hypothetical protein